MALAAVVLASVGSMPHVPFRFGLTLIAVALIAIVGISRVLAALRRKSNSSPSLDPGERARMIREARGKRR